MTKTHFDTEAMIAQMRAQRSEILAKALSYASDPQEIAFAHANDALFESRIAMGRIFIDLIGAGHDSDLVGQLAGCFVRELFLNLVSLVPSPEEMAEGFYSQANTTATMREPTNFRAASMVGGSA